MQSSRPDASDSGLASRPELSVVLVTEHGGASIAKIVRQVHAQAIASRIEFIVAAPEGVEIDFAALNAEGFFQTQTVRISALNSMASARAAAVWVATAPIVAFVEDHSFPDPGWAEALVAAHHEEFAAVGPLMRNANPGTALSWANLLIEYGPWTIAKEPTEMDHLPGRNSSYKQKILTDYGAELEGMLEAESILHWDLRTRGFRLLLEPAASVQHLNYSLCGDSIGLRWCCGRLFAAARGAAWPRARRLLFFVGTPLIPWVRLGRILRLTTKPAQSMPSRLRLLPALMVLLMADAMGEAFGYLLGAGTVRTELTKLELNRDRHLRANERRAALV